MRATFTCPRCGTTETILILENACLAVHTCGACGERITAEGSCIVCAHTDGECPFPCKG